MGTSCTTGHRLAVLYFNGVIQLTLLVILHSEIVTILFDPFFIAIVKFICSKVAV